MKDLNMRQETIKLLAENTGNNLFDVIHSYFLLDIAPEARETKAKLNYWDLTKIKSFCTTKETINWWNGKLLANEELVPKTYKELIKLNIQKTNNPVKKWAKDMK